MKSEANRDCSLITERDQHIKNEIYFCVNARKIHKCEHAYIQTGVDASAVEFQAR